MKLTALASLAVMGSTLACGGAYLPGQPLVVADDGAWVLHHPNVATVFWGRWDADVARSYVNGLEDCVRTDQAARLREYGVSGFAVDHNPYLLPIELKPVMGDWDLKNELVAELDDGRLPAPMTDQVYVAYLPAGITTLRMGDHGGYHASFSWHGTQVAYSFIVWPVGYTYDNAIGITTHELFEAFTDPDLHTGFYDRARAFSGSDNEVADLCESQGPTRLPGGGNVAWTWSQQQSRCL